MTAAVPLVIGLAVLFVILLFCYAKTGKFLRCFFFTAFTGIGALCLLWLVGRFIQVPVSITAFSVAVSGVLGIPGVIGMLLFHLL